MAHKPKFVANNENSFVEQYQQAFIEIVALLDQQKAPLAHVQEILKRDPNLDQDTNAVEVLMVHKEVGTIIKYIQRKIADLLNVSIPFLRPADIPRDKDVFKSIGNNIYKIGKESIDGGNWSEGLKDMETSLYIFRQLDDLDACADAIYQIGRVHQLMDNPDEARTRYRDALRLYQKTANQEGIAACKAALGTISVQQGFINEGVKFLKDAKNFYSVHKDEKKAQNVDEILDFINQVREKQPV